MKRRQSLAILAVIVVSVGLYFAVDAARHQSRLRSTENNLRQLGLGLLNYESAYKVFPPARMENHSWRIRMVPFLISSAHFVNYDFTVPWDADPNLMLDRRPIPVGKGPNASEMIIAGMPFDFSNGSCVPQTTAFVSIVGENAFADYENGRRTNDCPDGIENTIAIVQTSRQDIHWLHPIDLEFETMSFKINDGPKSIASPDDDEPFVCFADGMVTRISREIPSDVLRALTTRNGNEKWTRADAISRGWLIQLQ